MLSKTRVLAKILNFGKDFDMEPILDDVVVTAVTCSLSHASLITHLTYLNPTALIQIIQAPGVDVALLRDCHSVSLPEG